MGTANHIVTIFDGGAVLVGTEDDGLFLIDIEDPTDPSVVDRWYEPGLRVVNLATAWPTIVLSDPSHGAVTLPSDLT